MLLLSVYLSFVTCCTLFLSHYILLHKCMLYWPSWNWPTYKFYDSVVRSTPAQCIPIIYYLVHLRFISLVSHMRYGTTPLTAKKMPWITASIILWRQEGPPHQARSQIPRRGLFCSIRSIIRLHSWYEWNWCLWCLIGLLGVDPPINFITSRAPTI